jgi:threonine aldolase
MRDFRSDNTQWVLPEAMAAIARANAETMTSYGGDQITNRVRALCREIFETDVEVFPVVTGTAGNALTLAAMTPPDGTIVCHEDAHIVRDELGAPEFFSGGARVITLPGEEGKLQRVVPATTLSLTNATEAGTVYTPDETRALTSTHEFNVHLDGARFANAVASLGCSPAELTWRAGVDALVFGGTKNGLMNVELVVVFRKELANEIAPRWHRAGHRPSKMRFLSAQFEAYLTDERWLRNARHANAMAARLAAGLEIIRPVQANIVFTRFAPETARALQEAGFAFYDWPIFGEDAYRLVTGFATREEDVDALLAERRRPGG